MNPSREQPRKKRGQGISLEVLEDRQLLSSGQGSTFAIMPGTVSKAGQTSSVQFKLDPSLFTAGRGGKIVLGLDVAADPSTNIQPEIVSVKDASGRPIAVHHSVYTAAVIKAQKLAKHTVNPISTAVLVTLPVPKAGQAPGVYSVQVQGQYGTTGGYLVGFYLPGDAKGTGTVDATSLQTIMSEFGSTPSTPGTKYTFDADVNRDGKISVADLQYASKNLEASTKVSPVINVQLDPATDGPMHSRITNFKTVHFTGTTTPGATVTFAEINNNSPGATAKADGSGNYSIMVPLGDGSNTFKVTSSDAFGQTISGQISPVTYSLHPPVVINTPADLTSTSTSSATPTASTTPSTATATSTTSTATATTTTPTPTPTPTPSTSA
jgi:hypothetical protein